MSDIDLVTEVLRELDSLTLRGVRDWEMAVKIAAQLIELKHRLERKEKPDADDHPEKRSGA